MNVMLKIQPSLASLSGFDWQVLSAFIDVIIARIGIATVYDGGLRRSTN